MGSDLQFGAGSDRPDLRRPTIAEALRSAASLRSSESSLQALIGMMIETGPWTAGSICLLTADGTLDTAAYLDARAGECDRLQAEFGEGPALDAVRGDPIQASPDLADEARWTRWSPVAAGLGVRSTLALRLFTNTILGTVNLYSANPHRIDDVELRAAQVIAAVTSVVVGAITTERHLRRAMESRNVIGQAQGILMQRHGLTAEGALHYLRRQSQQTNVKLVRLARQIADTGRLDSEPGANH